jgi:hypothetical protein
MARSMQPALNVAEPGGRDHVRRNGSQIFRAVPNIVIDALRSTVDGEGSLWVEWDFKGTFIDGTSHHTASAACRFSGWSRIASRGSAFISSRYRLMASPRKPPCST